MKTMWKYQLDLNTSEFQKSFDIPEEATILHVEYDANANIVEFWAEVWDDRFLKTRSFELIGTGLEVPHNALYHGTVIISQSPKLIVHLYEVFN